MKDNVKSHPSLELGLSVIFIITKSRVSLLPLCSAVVGLEASHRGRTSVTITVLKLYWLRTFEQDKN